MLSLGWQGRAPKDYTRIVANLQCFARRASPYYTSAQLYSGGDHHEDISCYQAAQLQRGASDLVHYGMKAVLAAGSLPVNLKVATVGQGSAKALRDLGVLEIIAPQERFDSEALLALPELQNVKG